MKVLRDWIICCFLATAIIAVFALRQYGWQQPIMAGVAMGTLCTLITWAQAIWKKWKEIESGK